MKFPLVIEAMKFAAAALEVTVFCFSFVFFGVYLFSKKHYILGVFSILFGTFITIVSIITFIQ